MIEMSVAKFLIGLAVCCLFVAVQGKALGGGPVVRSRRSNEEFYWEDCGSNSNRPLRVTTLSMSPSPLQLPGPLHLSFTGEVTRDLGVSDMVLDIKTERKVLWKFPHNFTVPCIRHIGSCTYQNTCTLLDRMVNENWLGISRDFGQQIQQGLAANGLGMTSSCVLEAQRINVRDIVFQLPAIPRLFSSFAGGKYFARMRFYNPMNHNEEYGCVAMKLYVD